MASSCFHCGQNCDNESIKFDEKIFCCHGCKTVYEIINQNHLNNFYELNQRSGVKPQLNDVQFKYLDEPKVFDKLVDFHDGGIAVVNFYIPVIHCSSCIWLLESLEKINKNILRSTVNFSTKEVQITYKTEKYKLNELASFLTQLGYKPQISLENLEKNDLSKKIDRGLILRLVVAGFCFGNIMLFTIPEYMNSNDWNFDLYSNFFRVLIFLFSLPVIFYSAQPYFLSAYQGLKNKYINIDVPISVGILVLFLRSCYEVWVGESLGYFDSLAGLLFFMLIGKYFQARTYKSLSFDRNYKSFYPIAVTKMNDLKEENITLDEVKIGDRLVIRNMEILPADAIVMKGTGRLDNSFITGESIILEKNIGDKVFAGGKQIGSAIEVEVINQVDQSYLTKLWQHNVFTDKNISSIDSLTNKISKYFSLIILIISFLSAVAWYFIDPERMFLVVTSILIVACPCALGLSAPFTLGNALRILSHSGFYPKDTFTIEKMAKIDTLVFDKTGTLTDNHNMAIRYEGRELNDQKKSMVKSLLNNSNHPLSRRLIKEFQDIPVVEVEYFAEIIGKGLEGEIGGEKICLGTQDFVKIKKPSRSETEVNIVINNTYVGTFYFESHIREGITVFSKKSHPYKVSVLSGDNDKDLSLIRHLFPYAEEIKFKQSPEDKLNYIHSLQEKGMKVMMLGDGLNDAGALKQSNVGVAVADDINAFSPASDAILDANEIGELTSFLNFSRKSIRLVMVAFSISFAYNIVGLYFAITGQLTPLVAAILMPISSISIVLFATLSTWWVGRKLNKRLFSK